MLSIESLKPMLLDERERAPPNENAYVAEPKFDELSSHGAVRR